MSSNRLRTALLVMALLYIPCLATTPVPLSAQDSGTDFRWLPPRADSLRTIIDRLDQARADLDDEALRAGLEQLTSELARNIPDGGFPLSDRRWVGPGAYLQELLELTAEPLREEILPTLDQLIGARLPRAADAPRRTPRDLPQALPDDLLLRLSRDFPRSRFAAAARQRRAELLLEAGDIAGYRQAASGSGTLAADSELARWLATSGEPDEVSSSPATVPLEVIAERAWRVPVRDDSPWRSGVLHRRPLITGEHIFLQGLDEVVALNAVTGERSWETPIIDTFPRASHGSLLAPAKARGSVVTTTLNHVTAYTRQGGDILWQFPVKDLFPEPEKTEDGKPDDGSSPDFVPDKATTDEAPHGQIVTVTPPVGCGSGMLVAAVRLVRGTLVARIACFDASGAVLWNRSAGSAAGATYLALGTSGIALASLGERAYLLTQRGFLLAFHTGDGALLWAVTYPSHGTRGSRDALRFGDRFHLSGLEVRGDRVVAAPVDASSLYVWDSGTGELLGELPRMGGHWWTWGGSSTGVTSTRANNAEAPMAIVTDEGASIWSYGPDGPKHVGTFDVPDGYPAITGAPTFVAGEWWFPHRRGFYRVTRNADSWSYRQLPVTFDVEHVAAAGGDRILAANASSVALLAPAEAPSGPTAGTVAQAVAEARRQLTAGDGAGLLATLERLRQEMRTAGQAAGNKAPTALGEEILDTCRGDGHGDGRTLGLDKEPSAQLRAAALELLPRGSLHAQQSYEEAVLAARRGDHRESLLLLRGMLRSGLETRVQVTPYQEVSLGLAFYRLLQRLKVIAPDLGEWRTLEEEALAALGRAQLANNLLSFREVARGYPATAAGREASLELARKYYETGNRQQALLGLRRLVLLESDQPEAVEARIRIAGIYRDERRYEEARRVLRELRERYGQVVIKGDRGLEKVGDRASTLLAEIPEKTPDDVVTAVDALNQLVPVWRWRAELSHERRVAVIPIAEHVEGVPPGEVLLMSGRNVERRDARSGDIRWVRHFPRRRVTGRSPWPDRDVFRDATFDSGGVLTTDGNEVVFLRLSDGRVYWRWTAKELTAVTDIDPEVTVEHTVAAAGTALITLDSGEIVALELTDGSLRWRQRHGAAVVGTPQVSPDPDRAGQVALGLEEGFNIGGESSVPPRVEIRSLATGEVVQRIDLEGENLQDAPTFLKSGKLLVPLQGRLRCVDPGTGQEAWSCALPSRLVRIHPIEQVPQIVIELVRTRDRPTLAGIDPDRGKIVWQRIIKGSGGRITELAFDDDDIYVLEENYPHRKITRLSVPPVFLSKRGTRELPVVEDLELRWTRRLKWGGYQSRLRFDGAWVLVEDRDNCQVLFVSKETGLATNPSRYRFAQKFLRGRRAPLYFGGVIDGTLVIMARTGSIGLRSMEPLETTILGWAALASFDPLTAPTGGPGDSSPTTSPSVSTPPEVAARSAYRTGHVEEACRILEEVLERPGISRRRARSVSTWLEGISQERSESVPLSFEVPRLPQAPFVDGSLDEPWGAGTALALRSPRYFHPVQGIGEDAAAWKGWRDLSAVLFTGWSDEGFHIALDVVDDRVLPFEKEKQFWTGDCLLLAFDFLGDGGLRPRADDQLLTLALTVPKPQPKEDGAPEDPDQQQDDAPEDDAAEDENDPAGQFQVRRKEDDSGIIYEVTIPWATFRDARQQRGLPNERLAFRMNLLLTDDDQGDGAESYLSLSSGQMLRRETRGIWDLFSPEYFARVTLGP